MAGVVASKQFSKLFFKWRTSIRHFFIPFVESPEEQKKVGNRIRKFISTTTVYCGTHTPQGEAMGRPSMVATRVTPDGTIYVGGTAAVVAEGRLVV